MTHIFTRGLSNCVYLYLVLRVYKKKKKLLPLLQMLLRVRTAHFTDIIMIYVNIPDKITYFTYSPLVCDFV